MVKASTKLLFTGIAGAAGVIATTQIPDVKAAVKDAVDVTSNKQQIGQFSNVADFIHEKSSQVTMKSDILRGKSHKDSKLATFKDDTKKTKAPKSNINNVASKAMTDAISESDVEDESSDKVASYYDDSTTDESDIDQPSTPAEDAVVSEANDNGTSSDDMGTYAIKDGDTLATVAAMNGVSVADLQAANPDADTTMLSIGQSLNIPNGGSVAQSAPAESEAPVVDSSAADTVPYTDSSVVSDQSLAPDASVQSQTYSDASVSTQGVSAKSTTTVTPLESAKSTQSDKQATTMTNGDVVLNSLDDVATQDQSVATTSTNDDASKMVSQTKTVANLTAEQRAAIVSAATDYADQQIPYAWGGKTTAGLDSSGLVAKAYHDAGVNMPMYTVAQKAHVKASEVHSSAEVSQTAQPGDLLFWGGQGAPWQVAIYTGNGQYVTASQPGQQVQTASLTDAEIAPDFVGSYNFK